MSGLFGGNTPDPPNPLVTAAAQTSTNVGTAVANAFLNNYNQTTPTGSLTYTMGDPFTWSDPTTGQTYSIPKFTANQTLSPNQQQLLNINEQSQINLANTGQQQSRAIGSFLGNVFNPASGNFNADAYLAQNPDVRAAYESGALRGPGTPATAATGPTTSFDPNAYLAAYPDVAQAYSIPGVARPGETLQQFAQRHYTDRGQAEGRTAGVTTVPGTPGSPATEGPINETLGQFAARHYQEHGQYEGRSPGGAGGFDATAYLNAYPDVAAAAQASGMDPQAFALLHYQQSGQYEGRTAGGQVVPSAGRASLISNVPGAQTSFGPTGQQQSGLFNAQAYLQDNPDVVNSYYAGGAQPGESLEQFAQRHYNQSGIGEGRDAGYGRQQSAFGDAGDITRSYGPGDFSEDRSKVEQALYQRMDPQLQRDRAALEARLADQGVRVGSEAWNDAMHQFDTKLTDTRLAITAQAGQEQQRMMDMAAQRAGFENAAQMQAFNEARQRGEFANTAQQAAFGQAVQGGQFYNAAQQQRFAQEQARANFYNTAQAQNLAQQQSVFNAQNAARNQYLQEQYQQRNQPLNEINSLLSGSQVTSPNFVNTAGSQIPTTDIAGLINNRFNQDMSIYQQQNQNFQSLMGGIFGAIGGIGRGGAFNNLTASDRRLKENVERMGTVFAASSKGDIDSDEIKPLPIYRYSFKDDPASTRHIGPMAQDVEKIDPRAVSTRKGIKYINKTKLGSILR